MIIQEKMVIQIVTQYTFKKHEATGDIIVKKK